MARAVANLDVELNATFYPIRRALLVFEQGEADCIYSSTEALEQNFSKDELISSYPLGKFSFFLFTLKNNAPIASVSALENKQVGVVSGQEHFLHPFLENHHLDVIWSRSDALNVSMLEYGRFEAIIGAIPDIRPYLDKLSYSPDHPLLNSFDRLICHNTERNQAFLSQLSRELKKLKHDGIYQDIAGPLYVEFDDDDPGVEPDS
ncbi:substrate-binding periplasmic protein [Marinobacter lipolyticus]|uniref:substrate-binding periplasmic protein n=1 Tax=Marinobacter lipolyticus TaxID=209639 RepID=UPI003A8E8B68